ncbi:DeoR/GlpR transcriptional regulator [Pseudohalocynthiibacter aestuariivivens]|uniref:DeoR/GlpR family DNA-binding transcription regulator n=1 Tax=Roseovarius pelagicus TaxID=2980108 RepID=A0ABY6D9R6_9RHOB|nr:MULTISPECIES: DeoR/GlpR family DNA-binding transcription regulator [Rhodobacterales]QIE45383.1 DeoR/GlpR transcriptional regulator [Pseudohalocynthiibacter aestuariivivens]UXX82699.1 DeoR/GlpR family DNA-binding transcription regulator [Roseovarius pelagicus]
MSTTFRHPDILEIARRDGRVTVDGLAERFGVTSQTIRRDLTNLTRSGVLERVHGGAVLASGLTNMEYEARRRLNAAGKQAIGQAAAAHIPDGASVFLDIGTTSEAVARALSAHRGLLVVTNNLHVAEILRASDCGSVIVTGGALRAADNGLVGPLTVQSIDNFRFDCAVLACSAVDEMGDLLDFDLQEVQVGQALLRRAHEVILVADQSKFCRSAPVRIAGLADVGRVISDSPLPAALASLCARSGAIIEIVVPK